MPGSIKTSDIKRIGQMFHLSFARFYLQESPGQEGPRLRSSGYHPGFSSYSGQISEGG